jgi:hypothetical protein
MDHLSGGIPDGLNAKAPLILVKGLALENLSARTMPSAQFLLNRPRSWAGRLPRHARFNKIASVNVRYAHLRITIRHQRVARSTPPAYFITDLIYADGTPKRLLLSHLSKSNGFSKVLLLAKNVNLRR